MGRVADAARIEDRATGRAALRIIDRIDHLDVAGGEALRKKPEAIADVVLARREGDQRGVPVHANHPFGPWRSEGSRIVGSCQGPGRPPAAETAPRDNDALVTSRSFPDSVAAPGWVQLPQLGGLRFVLTGVAADTWRLFTAPTPIGAPAISGPRARRRQARTSNARRGPPTVCARAWGRAQM